MFLASVRRAALRAPRARTLTTSWPRRAALPAQPTVLLSSPSPEYLQQEEIDVDLLPPQEAHVILTDRAAEHFSHPTVKPSNLLVDAVSLSLLNGSTIDFATELIGSSFRVLDNPHAKGSGCGCGVSWELK
ncbi:hypothetical protein B0H14DRAFT_2717523 [Mycena olivaceomarginata]|nr:hypothetical protein B0H14DRAFT_2717523 [Mycena olivaceomarginata]